MNRTSLVPLPSSAVMLPGDLLNVSYTYLVPAAARYRTVSRSASLAVDWDWFGFSFSHDETDQTPLAGTESSLLSDQRRDSALAYVRGVWDTLEGRVTARALRYDSTRLSYDEQRLDELLTYNPYENLQFALSGSQYRTVYRDPPYTTKGNTIRIDASYFWGGWTATGHGAWRRYDDSRSPSETLYEAGLRVRRSWLKLDLLAAAGFQQRTRGNVTSRNAILHVGAVRRF